MNESTKADLTHAVIRGIADQDKKLGYSNPNSLAICLAGVNRYIEAGSDDPAEIIEDAFHGRLRMYIRKNYNAIVKARKG